MDDSRNVAPVDTSSDAAVFANARSVGAASSSGAPRRRWAKLVLPAAVLAVLLGLSGYLYVAYSYTLDSLDSLHSFPGSVICTAGNHVEYRYPFRRGENIKFLVSFANHGSHPVTVTDVRLAEDQLTWPASKLPLMSLDIVTPDYLSEQTPFSPTTLEPNEFVSLVITLGMPDIMVENSRLYLSNLFLDYRVLGINRHEYVPMGVYLGIANSTKPACSSGTVS